MSGHQKHTNLAKPSMGQWGRNEFAIIGTTCDSISTWVAHVSNMISDRANVAYVDASHDLQAPQLQFYQQTTHFQSYQTIATQACDNLYKRRLLYNNVDLVFINGNHFTAERQIVFIDERKKESLSKKLDKLTNVSLIITTENNPKSYDFLDGIVSDNIPVIHWDNIKAVADFLLNAVTERNVLKGLILAGGKSQRMGHDKSLINYHGSNQVDHLFGMLRSECQDVYVSIRSDQENHFQPESIVDQFINLGPFGGILSAFRTDPDAAWLIVASDLPFISEQVIYRLLRERDRSKVATCFIRPDAAFPDPLCTIWEPKSYLRLLEFMALGYSCPRKVLINNDVKTVPLDDATILMNVNDPTQLEKAREIIKN